MSLRLQDFEPLTMALDFKKALLHEDAKALQPHPALEFSEVPTSVYAPGARRTRALLSQREAVRHMEAYGGKQTIDWVYDCAGLYADTTSSAEWHLEREDGTLLVPVKPKGSPDGDVGPRELYDLLNRPNPYMLYDELMSLLIIDLLLVGNGYWFKWRNTEAGKPLALYRLAPSYVRVVPGPFGPEGYEYQPPGVKETLRIPLRDMIHFRLPNPHSHYYGMGVVRGGGRAFDLEIALTDTQASYYENRADPSLIVESERRVPRDIFSKLRMQLRQRVAGSSKAGELLVLEAGLKANTLSPSARDALFAELTMMSRDRIFAMFRASPKLFGIMDQPSGSDKVTDARREFDTYVIRPFMNKLQRRITEGLVAAWDLRFVIDYDYAVPREELIKNASSVASVPGIKVREVRRILKPLGIEESTGDESIDEFVLNMPGEEADEDGQATDGRDRFADRPLAGERGRPPRGENTRGFPRRGGRLPRGVKGRRPESSKSLDDILTDFERLQLTEGAKALESPKPVVVGKLPGEQAPDDPFGVDRDRSVDSAAAIIEESLTTAAHILERELLDHVEGKAFKSSDVRRRLRNARAWGTFRRLVESSLEEGVKRALSSAVMQESRSGRRPEDELDYDAIAKSLIHRRSGLRSIVRTLKERVLRNVRAEIEAGSSAADVRATVRKSIADWKDTQVPTIALTEAVTSFNEGTLTVAEELGHGEVYVTDGHDHDEPCKEADGQVWDIDRARQNRLEHPNCRRAFLLLDPVTS